MIFDSMSIIAALFGIIILYVLCLVFIKPIKFIFRLLINILFGGIMIFAYNFLGGLFGVSIGINLLTSSIAGILGIPGIALIFLTLVFI